MLKATKLHAEVRRRLNRFNTDYEKKLSVIQIDSLIQEAVEIWVENRATLYQTNDEVQRDLAILEVKNYCKPVKKFDERSVYIDLPHNYVKLTRRTCKAVKESCGSSERELTCIAFQADDLTEGLKSPFLEPSFEYEETIAYESGTQYIVFHNNKFKINTICLDFLRQPLLPCAPSLTENGSYIDGEGNVIKKDIGLELDNNFQPRKIADIASYLGMRDFGDTADYQSMIQKIIFTDQVYIGGQAPPMSRKGRN